MARMAHSLVTLSTGRTLEVAMTGKELESTLRGGSPLAILPLGRDSAVYVNPAHIVTAEDVDS